MAARVRLPVHVRLVGALPGDPLTPDRVRVAVHDAVCDALTRAPLTQLGVSGPGDVTTAPLTVVAEPGHEDVLVPDVLAAVLAGAGTGAAAALRQVGPRRSELASGRPIGPPAEPFDPARVVRRDGRAWYRVPFFDGGEAEVPLDEGEPPARPQPPLPATGEAIGLGDALDVAWSWHVYRHGPRWAPASLGYPGYYGLVRVGGRVRRLLIWIHEVRGDIPVSGELRGRDVSYLCWPLVQLVFEPAAEPTGTTRTALGPTFGSYELSPTGETATLAAVEAKLAALVEAGGRPPDFPLRDPTRRRAYTEDLLRDEHGRIVEDQRLWTLAGGPEAALVVMPPTINGVTVEGTVRFVTAAPRPAADGTAESGRGAGRGSGSGRGTAAGAGAATGGRSAGSGEGTGDQARRRGGPLGELEGGRRFWPTTGVTREAHACGPYLAEPHWTELVDDHGLIARMHRLVTALEMRAPTEECGGYLGQFALSAAATVSGLARGVGLGAVRATTTTDVTVRTDGHGNNGFLDIRPGASPEFDYLRTLAGIAREVSAFGDDVVSCYLDPRNASLVRVDRDWEPNAKSWALRFAGDFGDTMTDSYSQLYAETCRALLLQQLRSSRHGIVGRKDHNFEATLQAFSSSLDILGETVVELSTLKRAIRYSEQVHETGTVRRVLSIRRTVAGRGDRYELPAPIESVAPRTLQSVGDARVERRGSARVAVHQGRDWTVSDLDSAIGLRRALLNQIDPLFLQVPDLDALFVRTQREPGYGRTYLADLLSEMLRANKEMTEECSDPEDGAYFALEASQYVEREGGRDWRGLEYTLHGIHALADEQLRGRIGDDHRYAEGINKAIGRKAGFDRFLTVFATVGIVLLGLLCAPLGALAAGAIVGVAGLALTVHDVLEADRMTDLYHALENPELFLKWQEVQLAQLMAAISIAFSVFDIGGVGRAAHAVVGTLRQGLRVAERAGVGMAVRSVARSTRRELVRNLTREMIEKAVAQAVSEAAVVAVMSQLLPRVITPVLVPWMREQAQLHGTLGEVDRALGPLAAGLPAPSAPPGGGP